MKKDKEYECPHDPALSVEEEDAMNWLSHMLIDTAERCGPNARMATTAHAAVGKVLNKLHSLHELAHKQEAQIHEMDMLERALAADMGEIAPEDLN